MWDWGQEMTPKVKHSNDQTEQGKAWARALRTKERGPGPKLAALELPQHHPEAECPDCGSREWHAAAPTRHDEGKPWAICGNGNCGNMFDASRAGHKVRFERDMAALDREKSGRPAHGPYYHGSVDEDVEEVTPQGHRRAFEHDHEGTHAYATSSLDSAWEYAQRKAEETGRHPRVYEVEPNDDDVEMDPKRDAGDNSRRVNSGDVRSRAGFGVVRELPLHHSLNSLYGDESEDRWEDDEDEHEDAAEHHEHLQVGAALPPVTGVSYAELDNHLENWFHPHQLEAEQVPHPRTGWDVDKGEELRLHHPEEGEGPAHFEVWDHGDPEHMTGMQSLQYPKKTGETRPMKHVYRGVSADEWRQARQRGYLQSDQRGTIADWEGTNAAIEPKSAVSYLPHRATGHVLKIRVHPDDGWFTHKADSYVRTRERIPLDRVERVSPAITKGGKYGGDIEHIGEDHEHRQVQGSRQAAGPLAPVNEAITEHLGGFQPQSARDMRDFYAELPGTIQTIADALSVQAVRIRHELPLSAETSDYVTELGSMACAMAEVAQETNQAFRRAHATELRRLEDPRAGEAAWNLNAPGRPPKALSRVAGSWTPDKDGPRIEVAAAWQPSQGIFGPTTGMDSRLFEHGELRPVVRGAIMEKLDQALRVDGGLTGSDWELWTRVYLAGGSASEWAGERPNETAQDLDILIGVDFAQARGHQGRRDPWQHYSDGQIVTSMNATLRAQFNEPGWEAPFGGYWDVTGYVNARAWDIAALKPYAAYDLTDMKWAVRPPHLPGHNAGSFDKAILAEARAVAAMARAILKITNPAVRRREAVALWETIHRNRDRAFSAEGDGWQDPGNVIEKWVAYAHGGLLDKIRDLAYAGEKTARLDTRILDTIVAMGAAASDEDDVYAKLEEVLSRPSTTVPARPQGLYNGADKLYGGHIEESRSGGLHVGGEPVKKLYRVVDPGEWHDAKSSGQLQSRGGYTRASAKPDERWRYQGEKGVRGHTLEISYHPDDGWHASAEGYASTHQPIPLHRVRNLDEPQRRTAAGSDGGRAHTMMPIDEAGKLKSADYVHYPDVESTYQRDGAHLVNEPAWDTLRQSIAEEGIKRPLEIRGDTLLNGHNRYWVARDQGITHVPVRRVQRASDQEPESAWFHPKTAAGSQFPMTLYRGEGSHDTPSYYPKGSSDTGAWWTSNPAKARQYASSAKGSVYQVDVEQHEAEPRGGRENYFIKDPAVRARRRPVDPLQQHTASAPLPQDARQLGELYHSTPFAHGFPYDDWTHVGTRDAAEHRARTTKPEEYDLPGDTPVTMHKVRLRGKVYPHTLTDEQANDLWGAGHLDRVLEEHGLPSAVGHHVFPYHNDSEAPGSVSYLAHRSAIDSQGTETLPRSRFRFEHHPVQHTAAGSDGDRFVTCSKGHEHWGAHGAAGLLLRHRDGEGPVRYLLQKRSADVDHPGQWSIPSGARGKDESPEQGAEREFREEMGRLPQGSKHSHTVVSTSCGPAVYSGHGGIDPRCPLHGYSSRKGSGSRQGSLADGATSLDGVLPGPLHADGLPRSYDRTGGTLARPPHSTHTASRSAQSTDADPAESAPAATHDGGPGSPSPSGQSSLCCTSCTTGGSTRTSSRSASLSSEGQNLPSAVSGDTSGTLRHEAAEELSPEPGSSLAGSHSRSAYTASRSARPGAGSTHSEEAPDYSGCTCSQSSRTHSIWQFHTAVYDAPSTKLPRGHGETEHEVAGSGWFTPHEIKGLDLHPAFAKSWDTVRHSKGPVTAAVRGTDKVVRMHPRDLMQYVERYRTDDEGGQRHRKDLAESFRQRGYKPAQHGGMSGDTHFNPPSSPITLVHEDHTSYLQEGNHRTHALNDIGYDKKVPVLVKDRRTQVTAVVMDSDGVSEWLDGPTSVGPDEDHSNSKVASLEVEAASAIDSEPNRAVHDEVAGRVGRDHPELAEPVQDRTGTLRKMLGRASFFYPREEIDSAEAHPEAGSSTLDLAHHAARLMTDKRQAMAEARPRESWDKHPKPSDLDPDERRHGHDFTWHYALALDGAGHEGAADEVRHHYPAAQVDVAHQRHARGLSRDFPGSGLSPDMPPDQSHLPPMIKSQREGLAHDDSDYSRKMLDVASHPEPGLRLWRGERRRDAGNIGAAPSVGMHWSAKPEAVITDRHQDNENDRPVVWQSRLEHPEHQTIPRSHPMWRGIHESMPSEAEVRLQPHSSVHVEGAWVGEPGAVHPLHPNHPERNGPGWKWHPVGRHIPVRNSPGEGSMIDYSDVGIHRDAASGQPYYYGTLGEHQPGDEIHHHYWAKYPDHDRDNSPLYTTTDPALAGHMADLRERQSHGQRPGRMYQVRPTGPLRPDEVANPSIKGASSWQTGHPLRVVREIPRHEWPADLNSWQEPHNRHEAAGNSVVIELDVPQGLIHNVDDAVEYGTHVTLVYLGKGLDGDEFDEVLRRAEDAARRQPGPLTGTLSGLGTFPPSKSSDGKVPAYIPVNVPGIHVLQNRLKDLSVSEHKEYIPHVTLAYCEPGEELPPPHHEVPITFTHLTVRRGKNEGHRFPFGGHVDE
jgi:hypothetical protein